MYSNTTASPKTIRLKTESEYLRIKNPSMTIPPQSGDFVQLRMYFPRTAPREVVLRVAVEEDGVAVEEDLRFCVTVL